MVQLIRDALLEPDGSGHKSFRQAQQDGILPTVLSSTYDKLAHLPPALSQAFLAEDADRLRQVFPNTQVTQGDDPRAPSLADFEIRVVDGKVVKRVPRRLRPTRHAKGGLLGGKGLVALHLRSGLALALATDPDGETHDAKLVLQLLPQVRRRLQGPRLWLADRQFGDLIQTAAFVAEGCDHFLVRYHSKVRFYRDFTRPQGTLFQLSFCLLLYNMIQVVRSYVAVGQGICLEVISTELLFVDVSKQLVALNELVSLGGVVRLLPVACSAVAVRQRLRELLFGVWSASWLKAAKRSGKAASAKQGKREHTSVYRLLKAHQQSGKKETVT